MRQVEHHEHQPWPHHGRHVELALVSLDDPLNVGQAFRIGVSLGVERLHLIDGTPAPPNAKLNRTARGAQHHLPYSIVSWQDALFGFRQNQLHVIAVEYAHGARPIQQLADEQARRESSGVVLVVGNEARGLSVAQLEQCDAVAMLPMYGPISSLNVATALALAAWEFIRAR